MSKKLQMANKHKVEKKRDIVIFLQHFKFLLGHRKISLKQMHLFC